MKAAVMMHRRAQGLAQGSIRVWLSRAAWIPLVALVVLTVGWILLTVTGHRSLVVLTGSMEPVLSPGDVIIVDVIKPGDARPLDVVTFRDPTRSNQLVTHRVVAMRQVGDRLGFLTKGDQNNATEQWDVAADGTIGRLSFRIPALGNAVMWFGKPGIRVALLVCAFAVLGAMAAKFAWRLRSPMAHPSAVSSVVLLTLVAGAVTIPSTLSAFSSADANQGNLFEAGSTFGCTDPGIRVATATADTWLSEAAPDTNEGSSLNLYARTDAVANDKRTLVTFDLPAPAGCYVTGAWLALNASSSQGTRTIEARRVAEPWTEGAATWTNQPATTGTPATRTNTTGWNYWDVRSMVQSMYSGSNHGFLVKDATEGAASPSEQIYNSREQATLRPTLYVSMAVNPTCTFPFGATVNSKQASRDAYIAQNTPDSNQGNGPDLFAQASNTGAVRRSLITFDDLPTISSGCALFSATIRLYAKSSAAGRTIQLVPIAGAWTENQVRWSNQPATTGSPVSATSAAGWMTWDVTVMAQGWYAGTNNGVLVKDADEAGGTFTQTFSSRQDSPNTPELTVRWG